MAEVHFASSEEFSEHNYEKCLNYLQEKQINVEERDSIERNTISQSSSPEWNKIRRQILSSTKFHRVITKKKSTSCQNIVKDIVYGNLNLSSDGSPNSRIPLIPKAMKWGLDHEHIAKRTYVKTYDNEVEDCGIFLDVPYGILGASPDGLIDSDGLLEIKCPYTAAINKAEDIMTAVENKDIQYLKFTDDGDLHLRRDHQYYFQIIGQLGISGRKWCDFYVWLSEEIPSANFLERIYADDELWEALGPELRRFYEICVLPELIDPQYAQGNPIRNFPYVLDPKLKHVLKKKSDESK